MQFFGLKNTFKTIFSGLKNTCLRHSTTKLLPVGPNHVRNLYFQPYFLAKNKTQIGFIELTNSIFKQTNGRDIQCNLLA